MLYKTHVGVYAIIYTKDRLLLITKARGPYINKLDLPGGRPETGETNEKTLFRELLEETGVVATQAEFFRSLSVKFIFQEGNQKICFYQRGFLYFIRTYDDSLLNPSIDFEDSAGASWYDVTKLEANSLTPFTAYVVRYLLEKGRGA